MGAFDDLIPSAGQPAQPSGTGGAFSDLIPTQGTAPIAGSDGGDYLDKAIAAVPPTPSVSDTLLDVAKQLPAGIVEGAAAIPGGVASAIGLGAKGLDWGMRAALPEGFMSAMGLAGPAHDQAVQQQQDLATALRGKASVSNLLPAPQTTAGKYANTIGEFAPAAAVGPGGLIRRILTQDVAPAAASEAAGEATEGTPYETYARLGAGLVAGLPFGQWRTGATPSPAPLADELFDAGRQRYQQIKNMGLQLKPQAIANVATKVASDLTQKGFSTDNVPETFGVLNRLRGLRDQIPNPESPTDFLAAAGYDNRVLSQADPAALQAHAQGLGWEPWVKPVVTADNFDTALQQLRRAAQSETNRREAPAAWGAISQLQNYLANIPKAHVISGDAQKASQLFDAARADWAAAYRQQIVGGKLALGELNAATANSGMNLDNATRQAVKQLIRPNKLGETLAEKHGFSPDEIGMMNQIARGSAPRNALRFFGNLFGGGGGWGQAVLGLTALGAGYETGHPELAMLAPVGLGLRYAANRVTEAEAARLADIVGRRSALGRAGRATPVPSQAPNLAAAAALRGLPVLGQGGQQQDQGPPAQQKHGGRVSQKPNAVRKGHEPQPYRDGTPVVKVGKNEGFHPVQIGARLAKDGKWYVPDPERSGKFLWVRPKAA